MCLKSDPLLCMHHIEKMPANQPEMESNTQTENADKSGILDAAQDQLAQAKEALLKQEQAVKQHAKEVDLYEHVYAKFSQQVQRSAGLLQDDMPEGYKATA